MSDNATNCKDCAGYIAAKVGTHEACMPKHGRPHGGYVSGICPSHTKASQHIPIDRSCIGPHVLGRGYNMGTASGRTVYPLDLRPEDICIEDIAAHLSRLCRFNGALRYDVEHYSVAQHSVHVSHLIGAVPKYIVAQALLHDATEAYVGDMIRPLKASIKQYNEIEAMAWGVMCAKFDLEPELDPRVKLADNVALATEFRDITPAKSTADTGPLPEPDIREIHALSAFESRDLFLSRARELGLC